MFIHGKYLIDQCLGAMYIHLILYCPESSMERMNIHDVDNTNDDDDEDDDDDDD